MIYHTFALVTLLLGLVHGQTPAACDPLQRPELLDATDFPVAFVSPGFNFSNAEGSDYGINQRCEWSISMNDAAETWDVSFFNFSVEGCTSCGCDSLEIYDGTGTDGTLLATYCNLAGFVEPAPVTIPSNNAYVVFNADDYQTSNFGFFGRAGFDLSNEDTIIACDRAQQPAVITTGPGIFNTISYPDLYLPGSSCQWRFDAGDGNRVELEFAELDIEDAACNGDTLMIYDSDTVDDNSLIGNFYGQMQPPVMRSSGRYLFMDFASDATVQATGFVGRYRFV